MICWMLPRRVQAASGAVLGHIAFAVEMQIHKRCVLSIVQIDVQNDDGVLIPRFQSDYETTDFLPWVSDFTIWDFCLALIPD